MGRLSFRSFKAVLPENTSPRELIDRIVEYNEDDSVASDAEGASPPPIPPAHSARARPESSCDEDDSDDEAVAQPYKRRRCGHRSRRVDSDSE